MSNDLSDLNIEEVLAWVYKTHGLEGIERTVEAIATERSSIASYEMFHKVADELTEVGLIDAAAAIKKASANLKHEWQLPHRHHPACTNLIEDWRKEMEKKRLAWETGQVGQAKGELARACTHKSVVSKHDVNAPAPDHQVP
jgi:hypothetical protein